MDESPFAKSIVSKFNRGYLSDQEELEAPIENTDRAHDIFSACRKDRAGIASQEKVAGWNSGTPPMLTSINNRIHM